MEDETPHNPPPQSDPPPAGPVPPVNEAPAAPGFVERAGTIFSKYPQVSQPGAGTMPPQDEKMWAMICHLGGLVCTSFGLGFVPPLVIYLMQKDKSPFVACHAREALNFQLSYLILAIICVALIWLVLPILILMVGGIIMLVAGIVAGIKAFDGEFMALPFTIRMIK